MMKPEMLNFETSFNPACDSLRFLNVLDSHQGMYYKYLILPHITALLKMHLRSLSCISLLSVCLNILLFFSLSLPHSFPSVSFSLSLSVSWRYPTTADMWQFPFVNDKCGNYLSGCFAANQTLTSCCCICLDVRVCL